MYSRRSPALANSITLRSRLAIALFCAAAVNIVIAESRRPPVHDFLILRAQTSNLAWQLVESLTTDIGPRLAGTEADHRAVSWAETELKKLGFDRVWRERVSFPVWQRVREKARIASPAPQALAITALGFSGSTSGEITAPVLGFDSLQALQAAEPAAIAGKIVFVNQRTERTRDGSGYAKAVPLRYMAPGLAASKGALAVLIRSVGTDSHRFPHAGDSVALTPPFPAAALSAPDADQLQRLPDRHAEVIVALDIETSLQENGHSWNVLAQLDGATRPQEIVLLGAHLDSWDLGTGAIDDAAGVAITAAAASLFKQVPRPARSVRIVLFSAEEQGISGAKAYATTHADELANHVLAGESDFGAGRIWQLLVSDSSACQRWAQAVSANLGKLAIPFNSELVRGGPDMAPLVSAGVPVFQLKQDGTDYFDYHHTADDTLDKIDPVALQQNVAAWAVTAYAAANSDVNCRAP